VNLTSPPTAKPLHSGKPENSLIVNRLIELASNRPDQNCYTFLTGIHGDEELISYGELDLAARSLASHFRLYCHGHDLAVLLYQPGLDFIKAFFACLYAGIVAVPVNLPRRKNQATGLEFVIRDSGARLVLSTSSLKDSLPDWISQNTGDADVVLLETDLLEQAYIDPVSLPDRSPNDLALLQYTSGSTSNPKGVVIDHGNILANQKMIYNSFEHSEETVVVGWLPHYHDMGLIGNIIQPIFAGCRCILMSPMYFLQRPIRWMETINKYRGTTSGGPNFAFDLCAREIDNSDIRHLDLSSWTLTFCGAERIYPDTLKRFAQAFKSCGFNVRAFYPCYGLAEVTLIATGGDKKAKPIVRHFDQSLLGKNVAKSVFRKRKNTISLVGCGKALGEEELIIVNPGSLQKQADMKIGEIWMRGDNIARGYWKQPDETDITFNAFSRDGSGPYYRSGDLGFIFDDELFVTGRLKELIIVRGQNIYPHDVELMVTTCDDDLRPLSCIAFAVDTDMGEELVILAESKKRRPQNKSEIVQKIQERVIDECGVSASHVEIVGPMRLPRTSSGKLQRILCKQQYLEQSINADRGEA
jgi:acyl-CoA synthetase (AMP-forming)/AMP-acid ligase II